MPVDFRRARNAFVAGDVERLCAELNVLYSQDAEIGRLRELVDFAVLGTSLSLEDLSPATRIFLDNIGCVGEHERLGKPWVRQPHRVVPQQLDFIADLAGVEGWTLAQALNRIALDAIEPTRGCAVVGTMRDDGIYIMEWVAHYLALGFEHVFVYTNDNSDGSDELLAQLARHNVVTVMESEVTGAVPPEAKAFGHAMHLLPELRDYEWALFIDSDEFLIPASRYERSIQNVLAALDESFPDRAVAAICYDWLWFISDMAFERTPGLLYERFQHARPHWLSKCLIRIRDVQSMRRQHHPEVSPGHWVADSAFEPIDIPSIWSRKQAQYSGGQLNHYWPRSFQEFAIKKARGASLSANKDMALYNRPYERFFGWNGYGSPENHYPVDPLLLQATRSRMAYLRRLDGVAAAADRIEMGFAGLLARVADEQELRSTYARCRTEPGDL